jgi:putative DNA primase/helicase
MKILLLEKWLLSAVAAACHDPHKKPFMARGVLVLAGAQYIGKTRWVTALAPDFTQDGKSLDPGNKDSVRICVSRWITELGELETTTKGDMGKLKAFLTLSQDIMRNPYDRGISEYPRRTIFAASVNKAEFLRDETGSSRFWVIPVLKVNHAHKINMQQVFAQLYQAYRAGIQWWLTDEENQRLEDLNEPYQETDEVFDLLTAKIDWANIDEAIHERRVTWMTPTDVLTERCGFGKLGKIPTNGQQKACTKWLRKLTGLEQGKRRKGGAPMWPIPYQSPSSREWEDDEGV